jgi:hypothetical protein
MALPSFEEMRHRAYRLLEQAEDELRSDWAPGTGPNEKQAEAASQAREHIHQAQAALDRARDRR